jgi:hypothetical protein
LLEQIAGPVALFPLAKSSSSRLRRVVDRGCHVYRDTADSYGPGISETLIAKALYPYPAGLVVATKEQRDRLALIPRRARDPLPVMRIAPKPRCPADNWAGVVTDNTMRFEILPLPPAGCRLSDVSLSRTE